MGQSFFEGVFHHSADVDAAMTALQQSCLTKKEPRLGDPTLVFENIHPSLWLRNCCLGRSVLEQTPLNIPPKTLHESVYGILAYPNIAMFSLLAKFEEPINDTILFTCLGN